MAVIARVTVVTGNSQNPMNKKWKLAFTPLRGFVDSLSPLFPFPFRSFEYREVSSSSAPPSSSSAVGKKRSQKVGKNLILKNCHSVSIWKFQGYQLPFSDVCFLHSFLRICSAYIAVLFDAPISSFSTSSSLQRQTLYRVLLLFGKTRRQQANKVKRYWSWDESLERACSSSTCFDQRYLLFYVASSIMRGCNN